MSQFGPIASGLFSDDGANLIITSAAAAPSAGQTLTATSPTGAAWQDTSFTFSRTLTVSQNGTGVSPNWATLTDAVADAITLVPTATDPVLILMYPGDYAEVNPITVPEFVTISGQVAPEGTVIIRPEAPAVLDTVLLLNDNARIYGVTIDGDDLAAAYATNGILSNTGSGTDYVYNTLVINCTLAGFQVTGSGAIQSKFLELNNCAVSATTTAVTSGFECESGGVLTGKTLSTVQGTDISQGIFIHDDYSIANVSDITLYADTGIVVGSSASNFVYDYPSVTIKSGTLYKGTSTTFTGIFMGEKSVCTVNDVTVVYDPSQDTTVTIEFDNPALPAEPNRFISSNSNLRYDLVNFGDVVTNPPEILGNLFSQRPADLKVVQNTSMSLKGSLAAGGGENNQENMVIFRDDVGVFTDITATLLNLVDNAFLCDLATTASIDLASAPATIDGVAPASGVSRILVKDGSSANPGSSSVDNGIYLWNGTGNPMTRTTDFASSDEFTNETYFAVDEGDVNYASRWKINNDSGGDRLIVGTSDLSMVAYSTPLFTPITNPDESILYVGNTIEPFFGIEMTLTANAYISSPSIDYTAQGGWMNVEFWNGATWLHMLTNNLYMSTTGDSPYNSFTFEPLGYEWDQSASSIAAYTNQKYQFKYEDLTTSLGWTTTSVNGTTAYWIRFRFQNGQAANGTYNIPVGEQFKLHINHALINSLGFKEYFGNSTKYEIIQLLTSSGLTTAAGSTPTDLNTPFTLGVGTVNQVQNGFPDATTTQIVFPVRLPENIDTSESIYLELLLFKSDNNTGNVVLQTRGSYVGVDPAGTTAGIPVNITLPVVTDTVAVPGGIAASFGTFIHTVAYDIKQYSYGFGYTSFVGGKILTNNTFYIAFERLGTDGADTYTGDIGIISANLKYRVFIDGISTNN